MRKIAFWALALFMMACQTALAGNYDSLWKQYEVAIKKDLPKTAIGILMTIEFTALFYALIMVGFCLSLLAERYVFVNADLKSEIITGLILIGAALQNPFIFS